MNRDHPKFGVHESHCWQNQYPDGCKYGEVWDCPARPDVWPHPTYDEDGQNVFVSRKLEITKRPGRAWGAAREDRGKLVTFVHPNDPDGVLFEDFEKNVPEWAIIKEEPTTGAAG